MATTKQRQAARKNVRKAQAAWKGMTRRQHSLAQPQGRARKKPGMGGRGRYYRIMVRPKEGFAIFRVQDVGAPEHVKRLAGKRESGSWDTVSWLISKHDAHVNEKEELIIDDPKARTVLKQIRGRITHQKGDIFEAKPRRDVPESEKPTPRQRRAQMRNIKKAQATRRRMG
jgi:hypothetical protein